MHIHHLPRNLFPAPVLAEPTEKEGASVPLAVGGEARESTRCDAPTSYITGPDSRGGENFLGGYYQSGLVFWSSPLFYTNIRQQNKY
jgi:hypothetical protein